MSGDDTGDTGRLTLCRRDGDDAGADDNENAADDDDEEECTEAAAATAGCFLVMSCES